MMKCTHPLEFRHVGLLKSASSAPASSATSASSTTAASKATTATTTIATAAAATTATSHSLHLLPALHARSGGGYMMYLGRLGHGHVHPLVNKVLERARQTVGFRFK